MDLPVPPGFTITNDAARDFLSPLSAKDVDKFTEEYRKAVKELEKQTSKRFGGGEQTAKDVKSIKPLLLSVRASPTIHMPGVVNAVLNIGLNSDVIEKLLANTEDPRWVYDTYCHFLQSFGTVVCGVDDKKYKLILANERVRVGVSQDSALSPQSLQRVIAEFKLLTNIPDDPWQQLQLAIHSVYKSWYSFKAEKYRELNGVSDDCGVAVVIQSMVFSNANARCGVGCAYSRHPNTGEKEIFAEYAPCCCGEDVFAGIGDIKLMDHLQSEQPGLFNNLTQIVQLLEKHFQDLQVS
jgi:pyruvate, orthophosphate dikinase